MNGLNNCPAPGYINGVDTEVYYTFEGDAYARNAHLIISRFFAIFIIQYI